MVQANRCEVCGHIWVSDAVLQSSHIQLDEPTRVADEIGLPIRCAKCKSPYWNREGRWVDLNVPDGVFGRGRINGGKLGAGTGDNSRVDKRGVGGAIAESDTGAVLTGRVRAVAGRSGGTVAGANRGRGKKSSEDAPGGEKQAMTPFRGSGKCPHGYMNWFTCRDARGGCE